MRRKTDAFDGVGLSICAGGDDGNDESIGDDGNDDEGQPEAWVGVG